ncbi:MAG: hypothetical protein ACFFDS_05740 [Candidatus Thorarchaeota archaeon]
MNRKLIVLFLLSCMLLYSISSSSVNNIVYADPIPVPPVDSKFWRHIGILTLQDNLNISMIYAYVNINVDTTEYLKFNIVTSGNYTFYNYNQTENVTVVIPIDNFVSSNDKRLEGANNGDIILKVDNQLTSYQELILSFKQSEYLKNYIPGVTADEMPVIAFNVSFAGFCNTSIFYSSESAFRRNIKNSYVEIYFLVMTGAIWYGNLTERVDFDVYGLQPDDYNAYVDNPQNHKFQIMDIDDGKKYQWDWINTNYLYNPSISYRTIDPRFFEFYGLYIILSSLCVLVVLSSSIIYIIKKKKQK